MSTRKKAPTWPYQVKGLLSTTEGYREVDVVPIEVKTGSVKEINATIPSTMGFKIFWVLFEPPGYRRKFVIDFMAGKRLGKRDLDIIRESSPVQAWTSWVWAPKRWKINGKEMDTFVSLNMGDPRWFAAWEKAFAGASRSSKSSRAIRSKTGKPGKKKAIMGQSYLPGGEITHQMDEDGVMRQIVSPKTLRSVLDAEGSDYSRPEDFRPEDEWIVWESDE